MRNLTVILTLLLLGCAAQAQRIIEKDIPYDEQVISIEVPFASKITLKTWEKPSLYIKADLTTEDGKYLDLYELDIHKGRQRIEIVAKAEPLFKKYQEDYKKDHPEEEGDENRTITINGDVIIRDGMEYTFDYVIYVPQGAEFRVSSINGDLNSEVIEGEFTADLINGNIDIEKYSGALALNTINGEISIPVGDSDVRAETIHGNIYAAEGLDFTTSDRVVGQQIRRKNESATSSLRLSTINGNMYLNE